MTIREKYDELLRATKDDDGNLHTDQAQTGLAAWIQTEPDIALEVAERAAAHEARRHDRAHSRRYGQMIDQPALFAEEEVLIPIADGVRRNVGDFRKPEVRSRKDLRTTQFAADAGTFHREIARLDSWRDLLADEQQQVRELYRDDEADGTAGVAAR